MTVESTKLKPSQKNQQDKDKEKTKEKTKEQQSIIDKAKLAFGDSDASDKLALVAGVQMMNDFQKELFPVMVDNIKQYINDEEITLVDGGGQEVKLKRHKLLPKESLELDKIIMGENLPDPLPEPHNSYTFTLFKKMQANFEGFTEDHFWNNPLETFEFWDQMCTLKRQGFRRDSRRP